MMRGLCLVLLSSTCPAALSADGPPMEKGGGTAAKVRTPAVAIEHTGKTIAELDRTPQGELKAILSITGVLKVERPLRYRSTVLPPGAYPVKVTGEGEDATGRNLFFVIGPAAGSVPPAASSPAAVKPEEKKPERSEEKRGESKGAGRGKEAKSSPGQIRALFHLTAAKKASDAVELAVRPNARGDRFTLTVKAGSSQGKATLKLGEEKEK